MKVKNAPFTKNVVDHLAVSAESLRDELRQIHPAYLAARTGSRFVDFRHAEDQEGEGEFSIRVWGEAVLISLPDLVARSAMTGEPVDPICQAMLLHHFKHSDGTPATGRWIAFRELPNGRFYADAFREYTRSPLLKTFGSDLELFEQAAYRLNGLPVMMADCAFAFHIMPRLVLAVVVWRGDDEMPPSYNVLLDETMPHHLPTDACAVLGSQLVRRLVSTIDEING